LKTKSHILKVGWTMPYIKPEDRLKFDARINALITDITLHKATDGDMNYIITRLLDAAFDLKNTKYTKINTAVGVLECCKLELYRRKAADYEDTKIQENGDVY